MGKDEYMSFEDVLQELSLTEEQLQKLVSDVKLRAFRVRNTLKFRRSDVVELRQVKGGKPLVEAGEDAEKAKAGAMTSPTIVLPGGAKKEADGAAPTLLEVPPTGDTQELRAVLESSLGKKGKEARAAFGIEPAPEVTSEDEIGTELNFAEVPLSDTQELPSASPKKQDEADTDLHQDEIGTELNFGAVPLKDTQEVSAATPQSQDAQDTDLGLHSVEEKDSDDDMTDTVIPTIELSGDEETTDDTTDTVIPTIELSSEEDVSDDTSDTVIPTIELSEDSELEGEQTETAFPTIELAGDDDAPDASGSGESELALGSAGETSQETSQFELAEDTEGMDLTATEQEDLPTFDESPAVDTQQETSAIESDLSFASETEGGTGAETAPLPGEGPGGRRSRDVGWEPEAQEPPFAVGFGTLIVLIMTFALLAVSVPIMRSAVDVVNQEFRSPDYLSSIVEYAKILRNWLVSVL
jgi:hypothetical protein